MHCTNDRLHHPTIAVRDSFGADTEKCIDANFKVRAVELR
jgi:hypothetical protein